MVDMVMLRMAWTMTGITAREEICDIVSVIVSLEAQVVL